MFGWLQRPLAFAYSDFRRARIYCCLILIGATVVLAIGLWAASEFDNAEHFNRAGGVVTSLSLLLVLSQFHFENRHKREEDQSEMRVAELASLRQYPLAFAQQVTSRAKSKAEHRIEFIVVYQRCHGRRRGDGSRVGRCCL
jgi:hypothetical protein